MSRAVVRLALAAAILAGAAFCARAALADAGSVESLLTEGLVPSAAPALLGPITSAGRVGWACKPERSAASPRWQEADLPAPPAAH